MNYYIDIPAGTPGGYEGRHYFFTRSEARAFITRMHRRGIYATVRIERSK